MTKITSVLFALVVTVFVSLTCALPVYAQRVFVSGSGSDSNPCTVAAPCRSFQQAFNTAPDNGEIDVLDPAGYGPLTITHGISIQAHGFGGISAISGATAITINISTSDPVTLNGLLIDGAGSGQNGIEISEGAAVQIVNSVVRHFTGYGISFQPSNNPSNLLVSGTVASDNNTGIFIAPGNNVSTVTTTLSGITANDNSANGVTVASAYTMIAKSVMSNNSGAGLIDLGGEIWLARSTISDNGYGVDVVAGPVNSYGDNDINANAANVNVSGTGSFNKASTQ